MMSPAFRYAVSVILLIVALIGIYIQYHNYKLGIPGQNYRLTIAAYILIAIYAIATLVIRLRAGKG